MEHEPNTTGQIVLRTTYGDVQINLWCREAPRICHDLIQLCLEGSFEGALIDQVRPEVRFAPQLALPTAPAYEYHPRLKYSRRGMVGFDGVHYFIVMSASPQYDRQYTLLGQVVGDTIFNVIRMTELELNEHGRVRYPPRIDRTDVLEHPFDDVVPRPRVIPKIAELKPAVPKKNTKLLSFVQSDDDEDVVVQVKSSHDVLNDPRLSKQAAIPQLSQNISRPIVKHTTEEQRDQIAEIKAEQRALKEQLSGKERPVEKPTEKTETTKKKRPASVSALTRLLDGYKRPAKGNEVETLIKLDQFRKKLSQTQDPLQLARLPKPEPAPQLDICKLHGLANCGSCRDTFGQKHDDDGIDDEGWLIHRLVFDRESGYREMRHDLDNLVVIDPRERAKKLLSNNKRN